MNIVNPLSAILALSFAVITSFILTRKFGVPPAIGRYASIDGLRGYLAYFVFLHHSTIWYFYLRTGKWVPPPSNFYNNLGRGSVALFFMITGFLFFSKLIDARHKAIDWERLYVSRFFRLVPLYLFLVFLVLAVVTILSGGILNVPAIKLAREVVRWLGLGILGSPDVNEIKGTDLIVAGVTWTLAYEWIFYLTLPILAISVNVRPPRLYFVVGATALACLLLLDSNYYIVVSFLGGIAAAILIRIDGLRDWAKKKIASIVIFACIGLEFFLFSGPFDAMPLFLLALAFLLIACGNSLFGILVHPVSRTLGEMAYSIYLLHGITLFVTFNFILGFPAARAFSPTMHWLVIAGITPVLISLSYTTFRLIEYPAMKSTKVFTDWLYLKRAHRYKKRIEDALPLD